MPYLDHLEYVVLGNPDRLFQATSKKKLYFETRFETAPGETPFFPSGAFAPDGTKTNANDTHGPVDGYYTAWRYYDWSTTATYPVTKPQAIAINPPLPDPAIWKNPEGLGAFENHAPNQIYQFDSLSLGDLTVIDDVELYLYNRNAGTFGFMPPQVQDFTQLYHRISPYENEIWVNVDYVPSQHGSPSDPPALNWYFDPAKGNGYLRDRYFVRWWSWAFYYMQYEKIPHPHVQTIAPILGSLIVIGSLALMCLGKPPSE